MSTALITGTTSGIGYELAKYFAAKHIDLVLVSRNDAKLQAQKQELEAKYGIDVTTYAYDLSKPEAAKIVFHVVNKEIDILVNNAGFLEYGKFYEKPLDKELEMVQLHVSFLTELCGLYLPQMIARGSGHILNVASMAAFVSMPSWAVYNATKAYVLSFSKALHSEVKAYGVSVSALCPGATKTQFAKKANIENSPVFKGFVMDAKQVASIAYEGIMKHKKVIIPGIYNKLTYASIRLAPSILIDKVLEMMDKK